jgi:hypothetical protein
LSYYKTLGHRPSTSAQMRRLALLMVIVLLVTHVVAPATASPQPTPVCRFCGGLFASAAADVGVNATVAASEVDVNVRPDGDARWVVELELANGSPALADSPSQLEAIGRALAEDGYGVPKDPTFLEAGIDGDRVTLVYRAPDAADRHGGLLVVDLLHDKGGEPWYHVNAERFTVHGPDGTVVANTPESGRVDGATVTWTGRSGEDWYGGSALEGSPYVVYGPDGGVAGELRASAAVALATAPIVLDAVTELVLLQTLLFGVLLGGIVLVFRRFDPRPPVRPLAMVIGALGAVGIAASLVVDIPEWIAGPQLLAIGLAGLALWPAAEGWLDAPRRQAAAMGGLLLASFGLLVALHVALANDWARPVRLALRTTSLAFPLAAMVPLGGALAVEPERTHHWFAVTLGAFALVPVVVVPVFDPPSGLGYGFFMLALLALAVVAPVIGSLGLALGRSLALAD